VRRATESPLELRRPKIAVWQLFDEAMAELGIEQLYGSPNRWGPRTRWVSPASFEDDP
jgi:hypothetical protein